MGDNLHPHPSGNPVLRFKPVAKFHWPDFSIPFASSHFEFFGLYRYRARHQMVNTGRNRYMFRCINSRHCRSFQVSP